MALQHDPSTGFHDIKPLPAFPIRESSWFPGTALTVALALIAFLIARRFQSRPSEPVKALTPIEEFELSLRSLSGRDCSNVIAADGAATLISAALRRYLERTLNFAAEEMTPSEIAKQLPAAASRKAWRVTSRLII